MKSRRYLLFYILTCEFCFPWVPILFWTPQRYTVRSKSSGCVHRQRAKGINRMTFPRGLQAMHSPGLKIHTCQMNGVENMLTHSSESGSWLYCLNCCLGSPARSPSFYSGHFLSSFNTAILDLGHQGGWEIGEEGRTSSELSLYISQMARDKHTETRQISCLPPVNSKVMGHPSGAVG